MNRNYLKKSYLSDKKILELIRILKSYEVIRFDIDFCRDVDILKQNFHKIKIGEKHFTPEHIENVVKKYKVNANWIFGTSDEIFKNNNMNRSA